MATRNRYAQKKMNSIRKVLQELKCSEITSDKITTNVKWILAYTKSANDVKMIHSSGGINVLMDTVYRHSQKNMDIVRLTLTAIGNCLKYRNELPQVRI